MGFAGPEALLVGLRKSVKFDQKEEESRSTASPSGFSAAPGGTATDWSGPTSARFPRPARCRPTSPAWPRSTWARTTAGPTSWILVGKVPTILQDTRRVGPDGRLIGSRSSIEKVEPSKIKLVYSNVQLNPGSPPRGVRLPGAPQRHRRGQHRADSSRASTRPSRPRPCRNEPRPPSQEGPVLDQSIEIPKPPADPTPK